MQGLDGKVFVISGGATLIGAECCASLVRYGAKVVIADINETDGPGVASRFGDNAIYVRTDVTNDASIAGCLQKTIEAFGKLDGLVNVACTYHDEGFASSREDWHRALDVNLVGAAMFAQQAAPLIKQQGGGTIVNFGSISGKIAQPGRMLYSVSKAAVIGMTRNQAFALADDGIRVNSVSPGWTWSNVIREFSGGEREKADRIAGEFHLLGRVIDASEVGDAVAFLSSTASSGITGTDIAVDGGYTALAGEQKTDKVAALMQS